MIVTLSALVLAAMQTEVPVRLDARWEAGKCGLRLDGEPLPVDALQMRAKDWARQNREVHIHGTGDLPYRCIGATIFTLQMAGVVRVGFVSDVASAGIVAVTVPAGRCRVLIDGEEASSETFRTAARSWHRERPMVHIQAEPDTNIDCLDRVLGVLKEEKVDRLGFVGNDSGE